MGQALSKVCCCCCFKEDESSTSIQEPDERTPLLLSVDAEADGNVEQAPPLKQLVTDPSPKCDDQEGSLAGKDNDSPVGPPVLVSEMTGGNVGVGTLHQTINQGQAGGVREQNITNIHHHYREKELPKENTEEDSQPRPSAGDQPVAGQHQTGTAKGFDSPSQNNAEEGLHSKRNSLDRGESSTNDRTISLLSEEGESLSNVNSSEISNDHGPLLLTFRKVSDGFKPSTSLDRGESSTSDCANSPLSEEVEVPSNLNSSEISEDDMLLTLKKISDGLKPVKEITFTEKHISDGMAITFIEAVDKIREFKLKNCELGNATMKAILEKASNFPQIEETKGHSAKDEEDDGRALFAVVLAEVLENISDDPQTEEEFVPSSIREQHYGAASFADALENSNILMSRIDGEICELTMGLTFDKFPTLLQKNKSLFDGESSSVDLNTNIPLPDEVDNTRKLIFNSCKISNASMLLILKKISVGFKQIESIDFNESRLEDDDNEAVESQSKENYLSHFDQIGDAATLLVSKKMASPTKQMEKSILYSDIIDDKTAESLNEAIRNIKAIGLSRCKLSSRAISLMSKTIASLPKQMEKINLKGNSIDDDDIKYLLEALHNVKAIDLSWCNLSSNAITLISEKITSLAQPMEKINLSSNLISDGAAESLAEALCNIKDIGLRRCNLSSHAISLILRKLASLPLPMKKIDLSFNTIDDEVVEFLVEALHNIKEIGLKWCDLSSPSISEISKKLDSLQQRMEKIDLSFNTIDDEAAESLAKALHNINGIDLGKCKLSSHATSLISKKIASLLPPKPEVEGLDDQQRW